MINKIFLGSILSFLFLGIGAIKVVYAGEDPKLENSLLWKIEGNGLKKPSYIFGTMHIIEKEYFYFPKKLQKIIESTDKVVLEVDLSNSKGSASIMMLKQGTLFDNFSDSQKDSVLTYFGQKMGIKQDVFLASFGKMKPFVLIQLITQLNFSKDVESMEKSIMNISLEKKIPIYGLETMEEQIKIFDEMSSDKMVEMVMSSIRNEEKNIQILKDLQKHYKDQNLSELFLKIQEDKSFEGESQAALLETRNKKWIPKIQSELQNNSLFIAVGAAHLPGENGVIELLKNQGYTITSVKY